MRKRNTGQYKRATLSGNLFFLVSMSDGQRLPASRWLSVSDTLFPIPQSCRCIPLHVQASAPYQARHGMPSPLWVWPSNTPALRQCSILYGSSSCHRKECPVSCVRLRLFCHPTPLAGVPSFFIFAIGTTSWIMLSQYSNCTYSTNFAPLFVNACTHFNDVTKNPLISRGKMVHFVVHFAFFKAL